jgi:hypothetical protein
MRNAGLKFTSTRRKNLCTIAAAFVTIGASSLAQAQKPATTAIATAIAAPGAAPAMSLTDQIIRGRVQLEANNEAALATLQSAAQQSLTPLINVAGPQILTQDPKTMPSNAAFGTILRQAAEAHYWWGVAADRFARRNIALTAFARAARFFAGDKTNTYSPAREALPNLRGQLAEGLPTVAADDTLVTIASLAHGDMWRPLRITFNFSNDALSPGLSPPNTPAEFLITDGKVFVAPARNDPKASLAVIPPPFRKFEKEEEGTLPRSMHMPNVIIGYARITAGADRGLWRQIVKVHYAPPILTQNRRDDRQRAESLCVQFLKIHTLMSQGLGVTNAYAPTSGVTSVWLSEASALWPADEDPAVLAALGIVSMPKVNTQSGKPRETDIIDETPYSLPWLAAGTSSEGQQSDAPGDIVFFKMAEPRSEAEWLRELAHEYGHIALTPFNGFHAPLEPYGNGILGETLGLLWAGRSPEAFAAPDQEIASMQALSSGAVRVTPITTDTTTGNDVPVRAIAADAPVVQAFSREVQAQVNVNGFAALTAWDAQGPNSGLRRETNAAGLQYLQGLTTYLERVYGARILGEALRPLPRVAAIPVAETEPPPGSLAPAPILPPGTGSAAGVTIPIILPPPPPPPPLQAPALLESAVSVMKNPFEADQKRLPIWLAGALVTPNVHLDANDLIARSPGGLKAGERATCWLLVPANATALHIEWKAADAKPITVDGGWKSTPQAPTTPRTTGALRIETAGRSGWQRFAFTAPADLTWGDTWFEKANLPTLPPPPGTRQ